MEGLIVVIFVVWAIISSVSKSQKAAQGKKAKTAEAAADAAQRKPRRPSDGQQFAFGAQGAHKKKPSQPMSQQRPRMEGSLGQYTPMQSREGLSDYKPLQHRLDTTGRHTEYMGSLGGASTEGTDICDPTLGHDREGAYAIESIVTDEEASSAQLDMSFSKAALLQGVVMNEILTRPAQRKWGRR